MGKVEYSGKLVAYVPANFPRLPNEGRQAVFEAIEKLTKERVLIISPNIRTLCGLGKTATQRHLNKLCKEGYVKCQYAKVQLERNTVVTGVYSLTKKKLGHD